MQKKIKNGLIRAAAFIFAACLLCAGFFCHAQSDTVNRAQSLFDGIIAYQLNQQGVGDVSTYISQCLPQSAGTGAEWTALALAQTRSDSFDAYRTALQNYVHSNRETAPASREKLALLLIAVGSNDRYISETLNDSIGKQGVMSLIFGLHLLANGYQSDTDTADSTLASLLSLQKNDGGFSVTGQYSDVDVTAMALQALAAYRDRPKVSRTVEESLSLLSDRQQPDGDYKSYGVNNCESTAQVITALSCLGISVTDSRFVKNGNTLLDGLEKYRLADGSFCHKENGGTSKMATEQALYSLASLIRRETGRGSLYLLDRRNPGGQIRISSSEPVNSTGESPSRGSSSAVGSVGSESSWAEEAAVESKGQSEHHTPSEETRLEQSENQPSGKNFSSQKRIWLWIGMGNILLLSAFCLGFFYFYRKKRKKGEKNTG